MQVVGTTYSIICGTGRGASPARTFLGIYNFSVWRPLTMKLMRLALFFAAGVYFGSHVRSMADIESLAQDIKGLVERIQELRK